MNATKTPQQILDLIRHSLEPGEALVDVCRFRVSNSVSVTSALTNRYCHFFDVKGSERRGYRIVGHSQIPLTAISTVITRKVGIRLVLSFYWEGRKETVFSPLGRMEEAAGFADQLKHLLATKEAQKEASMADEISKFAQLAKEGIMSQDELERAKELFLGRPPNQVDQSIQLLRNIKELQKQGVLSESEFNMKKWDILSKKDFQ